MLNETKPLLPTISKKEKKRKEKRGTEETRFVQPLRIYEIIRYGYDRNMISYGYPPGN